MRQITVIRPGALGDTLLTLPALALLRAWAPSARLTFIARADVLPLARASGLADNTYPWDLPDWAALFDLATTAARLTPRARAALAGADAVIAWAPDPGGALAAILRHLGVGRTVVAPGRPDEAPGSPVEHTALWLARSLSPLGISAPGDNDTLWRALPPLRWSEEAQLQARRVWDELGLLDANVIALHPGSGGAAKRWAPERFAALARRITSASYTPLLLAGEAEEAVAASILSAASPVAPKGGEDAPALLVASGLDVTALAALLARCAGYVGNDSGVSHLAGLLGLPTVAIFGLTDPARWAPLGPRVWTVRAPEGDLARLEPETVWQAMWATLGAAG
jgi:ADP-heptose:LPS heptosyltransferase